MAEIEQLSFSYQEVATALIKEKGIHEGVWQLVFGFGIGAANLGEGPQSLVPVAVVPISNVGLARAKEETNLSVDAAKVNPAATSPRKTKKGSGK